MASLGNVVPSTQFLPTKNVEPGAPAGEFALFQSICFQEPYKNYSPEELRVEDYARLPAKPKTISQLEQELKQKSSKVEQLQLQVEQFQQQMTPLKEKSEQKLSKVELMQQQLASFKHQVETTATDVGQLQTKVAQSRLEKEALESSLGSKLKTSLMSMEQMIHDELLTAVANAKQQGWTEGMEEGRKQGLMEGQTKGLMDGWKQALNQLSDEEVRELLSTNLKIKNIFTSDIKEKLEEETAKVEAKYEAKLKAYTLTSAGESGLASGSPATNFFASASRVGSSTATEMISAPNTPSASAGSPQTPTAGFTESPAANQSFGPTGSSKPNAFGILTSTLAETTATGLLKLPTNGTPKSSEVKTAFSSDCSASVPPESSVPSQAPVTDSPFGSTKSFSSSDLFRSSDTSIKNLFQSTSTRAQSMPFANPTTPATNSFGSASPLQSSNPDKSNQATTNLFGSAGPFQSSSASKAPSVFLAVSPLGVIGPSQRSIFSGLPPPRALLLDQTL